MRERIESKHVTKEIKSQMPVIPVEIVKERGCTFCPYYLGNYEKQPRCMMKTCAWDDENERFHPILRKLIPFYKEKMEKAEEKFLAMKKIYTTLLGMFDDEMKQEELEKDECYGCAYGKCGPCIGIKSSLDNMFTSVNEQVGTIAGQVGQTPQGWNAGIFNLIQNISQTVIVPIAGLIITFVLCYELITMVRDEYGTLSINVEEEVNIPSGVTIGNVMLPSVKKKRLNKYGRMQ